METTTYDPCLLVITANSGLFGLMAVQTDDTLGFSNSAFAEKEAQECVFLSKERQDLAVLKFFNSNGDILILENLILRLKQKNQGLKLESTANRPFYIQQRARGAYIAFICQPMANYDLSAAAQVINPGSEDFARLNKRIKWQKKNLDLGLSFIFIDLITMKVFVMVDASFANNSDLSSQIGYIVIFGNKVIINGSVIVIGNIVHWFSSKCKRVTRSIFGSEIYAMANGVDIAIAISTTIYMIAAGFSVSKVPLVVCTDSFFLYECLVKLGITKEKRLMIDIMALRQAYERQKIQNIR
jgi:hypothetical protein